MDPGFRRECEYNWPCVSAFRQHRIEVDLLGQAAQLMQTAVAEAISDHLIRDVDVAVFWRSGFPIR